MQLVFLDWAILLALTSAIFGGYRLGLVARAASWIGLLGGVALAVVLLPLLLKRIDPASSQGRLSVVVVMIMVGVLLGQIAGLLAGTRLSAAVPDGKLRSADRAAGGLAGIAGVLFSLWLMLPAAADVPGWPARQVRSSYLAQEFYKRAPTPPDTLSKFRSLVGSSSFPSVFEGISPAPDTGPLPTAVSFPPDVLARAQAASVKIEGIACRRHQDGSGFAVGPNLIVTNAHVVAGETRTSILTPSGDSLAATVVYFDAGRDLAVLRVPRYNAQALPIANAEIGETGAVFGHPNGQDELAVLPAAVRRQITAIGRDLYDERRTRREVLLLSASVHPGDSGGQLVNNKGEVIGVIFALAPDQPNTAYALATSELRAALAQPRENPVSTGPCLAE